MYLKAIELENFKSFGRKTRIEFKEGFTAISGPNGSGKSNITDAIIFVLGPKSSKKIRAQRLTDLIYNGGKHGKPADYCRVSLIFDNRDRVLPIDEDEVKLTRYIKRASNEEGYNSYFYINGEKARLQDFASLLMHARIDADGYNFVQQGDITRIVEMTPMERRAILDDIAGITKFDMEIKKSEDKKRIVEENMGRVEVLLEEIKSRLDVLEKDRAVALKYQELENKLREIKAKIAKRNMLDAQKEIESYERTIAEDKKMIDEIEKEIETLTAQREQLEKKINEIDDEIKKRGGEELVAIQKKLDDLKIKIATIKINLENTEDKIKDKKMRIKNLEQRLKNLKKEIKTDKKNLEEMRTRERELGAELEDVERKLRGKEREISEANERFRTLQKNLIDTTARLTEKRQEYASKQERINSTKAELQALERAIADMEEEKKYVEGVINDADWRLKNLAGVSKERKKKLDKLNKEYHELNNKRVRLTKLLKEKEELVRELSIEYDRIRAKMESSQDAMSRAVMAILAARDRGELRGIYGTIAELGNVDEKYALAIEVAAGNRLMSIVCEDDEAAARAIEYLKKNKLGRAIFLPLNKMLPTRPRGKAILASRDPKSLGFAIDLISFDKKFESAFWYVFGDTVVVETLSDARRLMGGVRLVTLDGQLIEASGAMVGGSVERRKRVSMGNLDEIGEKLRAAKEEFENVKRELNDVEKRIDEIFEEIRSLQMTDGKNEGDIETWKKEKERHEKKLAEILKKLKESYEQRKNLENMLEAMKQEAKKIKEEIDSLVSQEESIRESMENAIPENISAEMEKLNKRYNELRDAFNKIKNDIMGLEKTIESRILMKNSIENEISEFNKEIEKLLKEKEMNEKELREKEIEKGKLENVVESEKAKLNELYNIRKEISDKIASLNNTIDDLQNKKNAKENIIIMVKTKIESFREKYNEAKREFESYGVELKDEKLPSVNTLKRMLVDTETQLQSLGPVNMKSIEEYDYESERYSRLKEEYDKLAKEKRNLMNLVKELNERKKDGLMKVFNAINENFKKIYSEVSNGGEAELILENPENPFKGGLIIKVKPPGKKFIRLNSLSGGEKSLTALAFIFAIQQYDPSPIYVLDEVDMFLDGVNAEIVGRIIKRNSKSAQFIVISLRKATLKFADHIIGVTQQGDGLSRVFIQTLPREEVMANA